MSVDRNVGNGDVNSMESETPGPAPTASGADITNENAGSSESGGMIPTQIASTAPVVNDDRRLGVGYPCNISSR